MALESIDRLERHRGHLLNWYDTATLAALEPRYVSTVDSGNLAVSLVALATGCREHARGPALDTRVLAALLDTLHLLGESFGASPGDWPGDARAAGPRARVRAKSTERASGRSGSRSPERRERSMSADTRAAFSALEGEVRRLVEGDGRAPGAVLRARLERVIVVHRARLERCIGADDTRHEAEAQLLERRTWLERRHLFRIGHNVSSGRPDPNHYDLLASEARIASFVAIARGDVPLEHWFALGRPIVRPAAWPVAQSWNGSMFEYLMPPLFLPSRRDTLLGDSESQAVLAQRAAARALDLPWGVSESAFGATDVEGNLRYRAFGTAALGIRRGLDEDRVVAPYASLLALGVWPKVALDNLERLADLGALGRYGFIDALDFTPARRPPGARFAPVEIWMAHHHGMSLVAIVNALHDDAMPRRVPANPAFRAVELLLHERVPWEAPTERARARGTGEEEAEEEDARLALPRAWLPARHSPVPPLQLLGNGRLSARVRRDGGSALFHEGVAVTRWSNDAALEWRGGYRLHASEAGGTPGWWLGEPLDGEAEPNVVFGAHEVDLVQRVREMTIRVESAVAPHEDIDIRRVTLANERDTPRTVWLTSHAEIALARPEEDERHPAFARMFVESRVEAEHRGVSFVRRQREPGARASCLLHRIVAGEGVTLVGTETDRRRWLGRHGDPRRPTALAGQLSGSAGFTLDPVMALRVRVELPPGATRVVTFASLVDGSREALLARSSRLAPAHIERLLLEARGEVARELHRRGLDGASLPLLQSLASVLLAPQRALRAVPASVDEPGCRQNELWSHGLSGDSPIVLLRMDEHAPRGFLETLVRAQGLWRQRGLAVDLVVLRAGPAGYDEPLRARVLEVLRDTDSLEQLGRDGGVHLVSVSDAAERPRIALEEAASVILDAARPLEESLAAVLAVPPLPPPLQASEAPAASDIDPVARPESLLFDNGIGGFSPDGDAYLVWLEPGVRTPAPWCNVLANERFGAIVSESGLGFSWSANSGERRLTRWSGAPVLDTPGEMLWLRDEATATLWSVPPTPPFDDTPVEIRHGLGHTRWRRHDHGLEQTLLALVPSEAPVRLVRLSLVNRSGRQRRLTATYFVDWVLGALPTRAKLHARTGYDARVEAILATNDWNPDFAGRVAFLACSHPAHSVSGDRTAFIGEHGDLRRPAALARTDLGGHFVPGGDPCGAWQVHVDLAPGEQADVVFVVGEGEARAESEALIRHWRTPARVETALAALAEHWEHLSGAVSVRTPDPAFDLMVNRWLLYQSVSSRLFARAGFYQASGAWGYRDQLQDVLALLPAEPALARRQILAAAARQFEAGDVMHWWHPPAGRGIRTRCLDDMLWLAYATARYVECTGELALLDADVPFLAGNELTAEEEDRYAVFEPGAEASLFEHCARALERGMVSGTHGLPLIGAGDWNDGMNRVGRAGRGESVWLAWFRIAVVRALAPLAEARGATARSARWREHATALETALDAHAWDGEWYVRAFDDAGAAWGSSANEECRIDVIAQAWGALAGFADAPRVRQALASADTRLVDRKARLARLLTPPFHRTPREPGYIKAYPPGIRENGLARTVARSRCASSASVSERGRARGAPSTRCRVVR